MSEKPIAERLQVKADRRLAVIGASADLDAQIGAMRTDPAQADVVLAFAADRAALPGALDRLIEPTRPAAIIWVAYPKLTSALAGDLSREVVRAMAADRGLDTVSQIAIDDTWSAMRLKRLS